jgi:hypothetical protein
MNILITIKDNLITIVDNGKRLIINKDNKLFEELLNKIKDKSKEDVKEIIKQWYLNDRFNI